MLPRRWWTFGQSFADWWPVSGSDCGKKGSAQRHIPARALSEWESRELLADSGVPLVEAILATSAGEAADAVTGFDTPVAIKISGADISHKTEMGGVCAQYWNA